MVLLVNKSTKEIYMGKTEGMEQDDEVILSDVIQVSFVEVQQGMVQAIPYDYFPFAESVLTTLGQKRFDNVPFKIKDNFVFEEGEIKAEMLDWYNQVMAKKSGIEIVGANSKIIQ